MTKTDAELVLCELADTGIDGLESFSPFCLKAHRALKLAGLPYARRHGRSPDVFRALNPAAQVPVLLVDGEPVADSTEILARIDRMAPGAFAHADDPRIEAEIHLVEELADTSINGFVVAARWADERNWKRTEARYFGEIPRLVRSLLVPKLRKRVIRTLFARDVWRRGAEACWSRFQTVLDQLERRAPQGGFWLTDRPSTADVALFAQLHSMRNEITPWQAERIAERRTLSAYLDRMDAATVLTATEVRALRSSDAAAQRSHSPRPSTLDRAAAR